MSTTKKVIIAIVVIIVIAGLSFGAVWLGTNWDKITSQTDLYTYQDMIDYSEEKNQELQDELENYKLLYEEAIKKMTEAEDDKNELTIQIANLQKEIEDKLEIIANKDGDISELTEEITELQTSIENLNNQILEKNNQITYYKELLEAYEGIDKLIVTFVLVDNGKQTTYDVQTVDENGFLAEVVTPSGDFEGWAFTIGGDYIEDLTTVQVTENMTIYGIFSNTVTYVVQGETLTEVIEYNGKITKTIELNGYDFFGWSLTDGGEVIPTDYTVTKDVTVYALLEKIILTGVEEFSWNGLNDFTGKNVWTDGENIYYSSEDEQFILNEETNTWETKVWYGIDDVVFDGENVWTDGENIYYTYSYIQTSPTIQQVEINLILNAETSTWSTIDMGEISIGLIANNRWSDGENVYISDNSTGENYVFNKDTKTWEEKVFQGLTKIQHLSIWSDVNGDVYYGYSYILNKETSTWEEVNIDNSVMGNYGVSASNIFYFKGKTYGILNLEEMIFPNYNYSTYIYLFDEETKTWEEVNSWNYGEEQGVMTNITGENIWTDGENVYCSNGTKQYILI